MKSAFSFFPDWPLVPESVFWAGLALLLAGVCGEIGWRVWRLPRVTGFGVIGMLAGSAGLNVIDADLGGNARPLFDIALGLLLFELGSRLSIRWVRTNPWLIAGSLAEATLTFVAVSAVMQLLRFSVMTATITAAISIATSPAMVIQLRAELKGDGQVTERMLTLAALNSMYAVVLVKLISAWLHQEFYGNALATALEPLYLIAGSLLLAYGLARGCNLMYRRLNMADEHSFVALIGLVLLAIAIAHMFRLSTVLTLLAAGIIVKNFDARPQLWPTHFGSAGWLLTVILFVVTPLSFRWQYVVIGGVGALGLIAARLVAKVVATVAFARPSGIGLRQGAALGLALTPMSSLAYMLVDDTYASYPDFDPALRAVILCAIVLLQLFAPLVVYRSLSLAGERRQ
jgi:NhaP-type Na+/H+ and K+/H+ antiporter